MSISKREIVRLPVLWPLYINVACRGNRYMPDDNLIVCTADRTVREYPVAKREPFTNRVVMIIIPDGSRARIECRHITSWPDPERVGLSNYCIHTIRYGELIATISDASTWFANYVGLRANVRTRVNGELLDRDGQPLRIKWNFNIFQTRTEAMRQNGLIPPDCEFAVPDCEFIHFYFDSRADRDIACRYERSHDAEFDIDDTMCYRCTDFDTFSERFDRQYGQTFSHEYSDYELTPDDLATFMLDLDVEPRTNKTEWKFWRYLEKVADERQWQVQRQVKFDWCPRRWYDFHVVIHDRQYIIEVDGQQHFTDVKYFRSTALDVQTNDTYKARMAMRNGCDVIRISQIDIWTDTIDWRKLIDGELDKWATERAVHYISHADIYAAHAAMLAR